MVQDNFETNIIKWYPFKTKQRILQIGENSKITNELQVKFEEEVIVIENLNEIDYNEKFDYILIYGYENKYKIPNNISSVLNENGKLLIIGNNDFGINNWSKYNDIIKFENHNKEMISIEKIKEELTKGSLTELKVFYVFPNYKESEIIINEKLKIEKNYIEKYCPEITEKDLKIFDERSVLKNIISNNPKMTEFFINSYFIEASKNETETQVNLASFNNWRKKQYRLITIIENEFVKKIPATEEAKLQIENMKKTIKDVKDCGINILDYEENGVIYSKFIKEHKTLDEVLNENYDNSDKVVEILNELKEILLKNTIDISQCKTKIDTKGQEPEKIKKLHFMKKAFWDMVPKNCFYIDNKYEFFDQEWEKEFLPVEFIIYRAIVNSYDLVRRINVDILLEKLDILEFKEYFQKIDEEIRNEIIDKEIYNEMYKKNIKSIDNLINEKKIDEETIKFLKEDNKNKQKYISELEEDNKNKQNYIEALEDEKKRNNEYIEKLESKKNLKNFWKGK